MDEREWLVSEDPSAMLEWLTTSLHEPDVCSSTKAAERKLRLYALAMWETLKDRGIPAVAWTSQEADPESNRREAMAFIDSGKPVSRALQSWFIVNERNHTALHVARMATPGPTCCWVEPGFWQEASTAPGFLREIFGCPPWPPAMADDCERHECKVCQAVPDKDGELRHGKGCYVLSEDGGGEEWFPVPDRRPWLTSTVTALAASIYAERAFERMPILADAIEEAGCCNQPLLRHLRGEEICTAIGEHHGDRCSDGRIQSPNAQFTRSCPACKRTGWTKLRGPHVIGCWALDLILGKD
jgi:hypothetical protein